MHPSKQALEAAAATWQASGPETPAEKRLRTAVEAAFAQHSPNGNVGWQAVACLAIMAGFFLALVALIQ